MPRFFRPILLVTLIAAITLLAPRLIGGMPSPSTLTAVMTVPDGTPCDRLCLFGVLPGETTMDQAAVILHSHPLTHDALWFDDRTLKLSGPDAYIAFSPTRDGLVDSITFADDLSDSGIAVPGSLVASIMLGELIDTFGAPLVILPGSEYFVVSFPLVGIMAASARSHDFTLHVQPSTRLSMVMISAIRPCPKQGAMLEVRSWIGFTAIKRYLDDVMQYEVLHRNSGVPVPPYASCQK